MDERTAEDKHTARRMQKKEKETLILWYSLSLCLGVGAGLSLSLPGGGVLVQGNVPGAASSIVASHLLSWLSAH